jgi:hypothetical protein
LQLGLVEQIKQEDNGQPDDQPHAQIFIKCIQETSPNIIVCPARDWQTEVMKLWGIITS